MLVQNASKSDPNPNTNTITARQTAVKSPHNGGL